MSASDSKRTVAVGQIRLLPVAAARGTLRRTAIDNAASLERRYCMGGLCC